MENRDTICAIATAQGGAIGLVRVSGPEAIDITDRIFSPLGHNAVPLAQRKAYTIAFGHIKDNDDVVDEVLVSVFRAPHSYTGENSVEISCHGSSFILQKVMQLLIANGCRAAGPGEYTQRAFLNGKMDLSQAEAVADLIASSTAAQHNIAMKQMRGGISQELALLREKLLRLTSLLELELDFSDHEELEFANRADLCKLAQQTANTISQLVGSFSTGQAIKEGVPVAIIGATNAGKSSLLNQLVGEERAIVSDIHGTTRDVIEDTTTIEGFIFRFIDTAGLRKTIDKIEKLGIERSYKEMQKAEIVLYVIDATLPLLQCQKQIDMVSEQCVGKKVVIVFNKMDIASSAMLRIKEVLSDSSDSKTRSVSTDGVLDLNGIPFVMVSSKTGKGFDELRKILLQGVQLQGLTSSVVVSNMRHYEALSTALSAIKRVCDGLSSGLPSDLVSLDLRDCLFHLSEITGGEITTQEVIENIFKHFCIGK
jgi:tRNA modification GTPase